MTSTEPRAPRYDPDIEYVGFAVSSADGRAGRVDRDTDEVSPWQLVVRPGRRVRLTLTRAELRHLPKVDLA